MVIGICCGIDGVVEGVEMVKGFIKVKKVGVVVVGNILVVMDMVGVCMLLEFFLL